MNSSRRLENTIAIRKKSTTTAIAIVANMMDCGFWVVVFRRGEIVKNYSEGADVLERDDNMMNQP